VKTRPEAPGPRAAGARPPASTARRWAVDAAIAAAVTAAQVAGTSAGERWQPGQGPVSPLAYVLLAAGGMALIVRRRYPVAVLAVTLATTLWAAGENAHVIYLGLIVAFFTAVLARKRVAAVASLVIGYAASVWPWLIGQSGHPSAMFAVGLAAGLIFLLSAAELIRSRSQRTAALQRSREEELRRHASEERMRMARDLHDLVAHNISVINVQANTALHLMDRQPERARSALTTINDVSKQALVELRSVLGVLRDVDESAPRTPSPGLARLGDLVDSAASAGLTVRIDTGLDVTGPRGTGAGGTGPGRAGAGGTGPGEGGEAGWAKPPLPADVDLAAYRIIQEAITNSARHSGGSTATVRVSYGDGALIIEVDDDGVPRFGGRAAARASGPANGLGNGIVGMTERAKVLGGTLQAGPRPEGGFSVRAWLPVEGSDP
jgi:signal transduction histidine kinase